MAERKLLKKAVEKTMLVSLLVDSILILVFLVLSFAREINVKEKITQLKDKNMAKYFEAITHEP